MSLKVERRLALWLIVVCAAMASSAFGMISFHAEKTSFSYVGGTERIQYGCPGQLEVRSFSMTFRCSAGSITIPYRSITRMEYRPKLSRTVLGMKLGWVSMPDGSGHRQNLFFTVLYRQDRRTHAIVLKVSPEEMRPYLAVIELHTGKRIHVWDYRGFD
jgi:hypothetical protein